MCSFFMLEWKASFFSLLRSRCSTFYQTVWKEGRVGAGGSDLAKMARPQLCYFTLHGAFWFRWAGQIVNHSKQWYCWRWFRSPAPWVFPSRLRLTSLQKTLKIINFVFSPEVCIYTYKFAHTNVYKSALLLRYVYCGRINQYRHILYWVACLWIHLSFHAEEFWFLCTGIVIVLMHTFPTPLWGYNASFCKNKSVHV